MTMKVLVQLVPEEGGGFTVYAPQFPGCASQGETEEEALNNIREVIPVFIEIWKERADRKMPFTREIEIEA